MSAREFSWSDEARLIVWPPDHPSPMFRSDLASCVRRALEIAEGEPPPAKVEIAHSSPGLIQLDEIRRMAADPTFPPPPLETIEPDDLKFAPMSQ